MFCITRDEMYYRDILYYKGRDVLLRTFCIIEQGTWSVLQGSSFVLQWTWCSTADVLCYRGAEMYYKGRTVQGTWCIKMDVLYYNGLAMYSITRDFVLITGDVMNYKVCRWFSVLCNIQNILLYYKQLLNFVLGTIEDELLCYVNYNRLCSKGLIWAVL